MDIRRDLREWEGWRDEVYDDLCGKPWLECAAKREQGILDFAMGYYVGADSDTVETLTLKEVFDDSDICPGGNPTIGMGCNLSFKVPESVLLRYAQIEIEKASDTVRLRFGLGADPVRRSVLTNMAFNGGAGIFDKFPAFVAAVREASRMTSDERAALVNSEYCPVAEVERAEALAAQWAEAALELVYADSHDVSKGHTALYENHPARWREMAYRLRTGKEGVDSDEERS